MQTQYIQPQNLSELRTALQEQTPHSVILAGGTDLMVALRKSRPVVDRYLDPRFVQEMHGITQEQDQLRIGAMTTHTEASEDPAIRRYFAALAMACSAVGSQQIRNKGTLGGSLANASPAGDIMPCVCLFRGDIELLSPEGFRRLPVGDFLLGPGRTCLSARDIITAIFLPLDDALDSCFVKLGNRKEVSTAQISLCLSWGYQDGHRVRQEAWLGAVDEKPIFVENAAAIDQDIESFSSMLSDRIQRIRLHRKRDSKLKITEAEKRYKERAIRGVVFDGKKRMEEVSDQSYQW